MSEELKISFFEKNPRVCPVCSSEFHHETLLTGGGRLIAGELRTDLRRMYEKSSKYGIIYPLIYVVLVCPECLYASFPEDFNSIDTKRMKDIMFSLDERKKYMEDFFGSGIDFRKNRNLLSGAASYFLALDGYHYHTKETAPTLKKALCSIRLTWVLEDLSKMYPNDNYEKLIPFFQYKASTLYSDAIEHMATGKETFDKLKSYGPDIDNNFGYEGMLYMGALLGFRSSRFIPDYKVKANVLVLSKRKISKVFGAGKSSKSKPSALLEKIKELYQNITEELEHLHKEYGVDIN